MFRGLLISQDGEIQILGEITAFDTLIQITQQLPKELYKMRADYYIRKLAESQGNDTNDTQVLEP
jgi:hypothetical protein